MDEYDIVYTDASSPATFSYAVVEASVSCDGTLTYGSVPTGTSVPSTDAEYKVCVKAVDATGDKDNTVYVASDSTFVRDTTAPIFVATPSITAYAAGKDKSGVGKTRAGIGDTVKLSFEFSEDVVNPLLITVIIAGQKTGVTRVSGNEYEAEIIVDDTAIEGTVSFDISSFTDLAGNAVSTSLLTGTDSNIVVDTTIPSIVGDHTFTASGDPEYATVGDTLTLAFTVSESLESDPSVTIAGEEAVVSSSGNDYTATYEVTGSSTEGAVTYDIGDLTDLSSNTHDPTSVTTDITIDRTAPVVTLTGSATVTISAGDTYQEQGSSTDTGEKVIITGTVDTQVAGTYTLTYSATDAAGNEGTAQRTVIVESEVPLAPGSLIVLSTTATTATLSWNTPSNGGLTITNIK